MPSLDQRRFIGAAVRSVMAQQVEDLELVVMDGGSSDGTLTDLVSLAAEFPGRLRWFSAPDGGPADAVHRAIEAARAPLVGWLNSDDLYTPGALARVLDHVARNPGDVMVYGHGEHVDERGALIERYPTRPPSTPLDAFAHGCFVCQPTACFRRDAYVAVGGLDRTLRASFDFDLWLRMFRAFPGRIGFIDAVQAQSRLHEGAITLRLRERVAMEGLAVVHRHLGAAPGHWLLTHLDELCARHPFHAEPKSLRGELERLVAAARSLLSPNEAQRVLERVADDRRVQLATPELYVDVHADGWAGDVLDVRLRQLDHAPWRGVRLACTAATPGEARLRIEICAPDGAVQRLRVDGNGAFEFAFDVADRRPRSAGVWRVRSEGAFVPAELEAGSTDTRALAFKVERAEPF